MGGILPYDLGSEFTKVRRLAHEYLDVVVFVWRTPWEGVVPILES